MGRRSALVSFALALGLVLPALAQEPPVTQSPNPVPENSSPDGQLFPDAASETFPADSPLLPSQQWSALTVVHGLPSDTVRAVAQDRDGLLWIGTDRGLVRHDGRRIERPGQDRELPAIRSLAIDRQGTLWAGTDAGAFRTAGAKLLPVAATAGQAIDAIETGPDGSVTAASRTGTLYRADASLKSDLAAIRTIGKEAGNTLGGPEGPLPVTSIASTPSGLALGTRGRGLLLVGGDSILEVTAKTGPFYVNALALAGETLYAGADTGPNGRGLLVLENSRLRPVDLRTGTVTALAAGPRGELWVGTKANGLFLHRRDGTVAHFDFASTRGGLRSDRVLSLFLDRDGVVWAGTDRGLCRFDPGAPRPVRLGRAPGSNFVRVLYRDSEARLWAGTHRGLFVREPAASEWKPVETFAGRAVHALYEISPGRLLAGTASDLMIKEPGDRWTQIPAPPESPGTGSVRAIQALSGVVYLAHFGSGLERLEGDQRTLVWPAPGDPEALRQVISLSSVGNALWIGTATAGAFALERGTVRPLETPGASPSPVWSAVSEGTAVWLGTGSGLFHLDSGRLSPVIGGFEVRQVIRPADGGAGVWCATQGSGLVRVTRAPGGSFLSARIGTDHGLPSDGVYALADLTDGKARVLAIGTNRGIALYEPAQAPPDLRILRVISNRPHPPEEWRALRLPHPQNSVLLEVAASGGRTYPEHYQYLFTLKLPGGGSRSQLQREPQFATGSLSAGHYQLLAQAFSTDLLPSGQQRLNFEVGEAPLPWVSIGLAVLLGLSMTALAWGYAQNRRLLHANRALAETRLQLVHETESERRRIARDLHDQTLADLRGLLLRGVEKDPRGFKDAVEAISTEIRRICEDLSPSVLENVGLRAAMDWALELAVSQVPPGKPCQKEYRCPDDLDDRLRLDGTVQIQIYRIVQEALTNAIRHSGATKLALDVELRSVGDLTITVTDNGSGFDIAGVEGGRGLANIRSRASLIGARVTWRSSPGSGTSFVLRLNA